MKHDEYPSLYRSCDEISSRFQAVFYRIVRWHLSCLIIAAALSVVNSTDANVAIFQAVILLGALGCSVYLFARRPDRYWYAARAVAESIKTATWRFVSRAEPFEASTLRSRGRFATLLKSIVEQNQDVTKLVTAYLSGEQITPAMLVMREQTLEVRHDRYLEERIREQQEWYATKASFNRRKANKFFTALVVTNAVAVVLAIARVHYVEASIWPTDVVIALAAALLAWIQSKRFSDLAASYALAAHEISILMTLADRPQTEGEFSRFVGDAENAFSREHTQWVARKDE